MTQQDNNTPPPPPKEPEPQMQARTFSRLIQEVAEYWGVDPNRVMDLGRSFIKCKQDVQVPASRVVEFLMICREHRLNPATREIYGFYSFNNRTGWTLQTGVEIDGWLKLANQHPNYDGFEQDFEFAVNPRGERIARAVSCTTRVYRKDRSRPTVVKLFMDEWCEDTPVWGKKPNWQLGVKGIKHGLRCAFGFAGIGDADVEEASTNAPRGVAVLPADLSLVAEPQSLAHKPVEPVASQLPAAPDREALGVTSKPASWADQHRNTSPAPQPEQEPSGTDDPPAPEQPRVTPEAAKQFGAVIAKHRKARKWGLGSAAAKLEIDGADLSAIEAGDAKTCATLTRSDVERLASALADPTAAGQLLMELCSLLKLS